MTSHSPQQGTHPGRSVDDRHEPAFTYQLVWSGSHAGRFPLDGDISLCSILSREPAPGSRSSTGHRAEGGQCANLKFSKREEHLPWGLKITQRGTKRPPSRSLSFLTSSRASGRHWTPKLKLKPWMDLQHTSQRAPPKMPGGSLLCQTTEFQERGFSLKPSGRLTDY